jgi:hypothetical protein
MSIDPEEFEKAREMRRIAFTGLGIAVVGLSLIMGFAFWLAYSH